MDNMTTLYDHYLSLALACRDIKQTVMICSVMNADEKRFFITALDTIAADERADDDQ